MDVQATRRAVAAIAVVGKIDGHDVIRRESVLDMVQRQERELQAWKDALWKACGDDEQMVNEYVDSQRMPA
jgi:hypothetical protein